jgi:acyl-CoA thioesterase II
MDASSNTKPPMALPPLAERLAIETIGGDVFEGHAPENYGQRIYGGHLLAQALLAARETVPSDRRATSLQAYFVAPGDPTQALDYTVDRLRDGRSFSVRSVDAMQGGRLLMTARTLFGTRQDGEGTKHLVMPPVPDPEALPPLHLREPRRGNEAIFNWPPDERWWEGPRPFDIRFVDALDGDHDRRCFWFRSEPVVTDDQNTHRAVLAFTSDRSLISAISHVRGDLRSGTLRKGSSLDHAMWFHSDVTAGEWLLYVQSSPHSAEGLGIAQGHLYNRHGHMVASVMQQGIRAAERQ